MDLMTRRRALLAQVESGGKLPSEYQEVEYLQSSGTQYIFLSNGGDINGVECTFQYVESSQYAAIYGSIRPGNGDVARYFINIYNSQLQISMGASDGVHTKFFSTNLLSTHTVKCGIYFGNKIIFDGTEYESAETQNRTNGMCIFGANETGTNKYLSKSRVYDIKFYVGNESKHMLVPCYRKSDDKPGMYDLVTETFYTNAGTGEFTVGANVN